MDRQTPDKPLIEDPEVTIARTQRLLARSRATLEVLRQRLAEATNPASAIVPISERAEHAR